MLLFDDQKRLTEAFGPEQAEVIAHILEKQAEKQKDELATKHDLKEMEVILRKELADVRKEIAMMETKITQRMFTGFGVVIAVLGFLIKF